MLGVQVAAASGVPQHPSPARFSILWKLGATATTVGELRLFQALHLDSSSRVSRQTRSTTRNAKRRHPEVKSIAQLPDNL